MMAYQVTCPECKRDFDLLEGQDAQEWLYGHDCEVSDLLIQDGLEFIAQEEASR